MTVNNELLDEMRELLDTEFGTLTTEGLNFAGRKEVKRAVYVATQAGDNPYKKTGAWAIEGTPDTLTLINAEYGQAKKWTGEDKVVVGDARIEISQHSFTKADLLGTGPDYKGKRVIYQVDGELYSPVNGSVKDLDGLTWQLVLKRIEQ